MKKSVLFLLKLYQRLFSALPKHCIYTPSCSNYAREAFESLSFFLALKLTVKRIFRCHPFAKGGYDPLR